MSTAALRTAPDSPAVPARTGLRSTAAAPAVAIHDLHRHFGEVRAVDGLSLEIPRGQVLAFLGPNGAGKSTTLDVVLGFARPDSGSVEVLGDTPARAVSRGRVGGVLQTGGLLPGYTVAETLAVVASLHRGSPDVDAAVRRARLEPLLRRRVSRLSGGERQRLRLALALLPDPELLVLDEPTTGMDVTARAAFWQEMRAQAVRSDRTIVFATHYLQEAANVADRIVIIDHGRTVADGTIDELRAGMTTSTVTATWHGIGDGADARTLLAPLGDAVSSLAVRGEHVEIRTAAPDDVARLLLTRSPAQHLGISAPSLDDIFTGLVDHRPPGA